MLMKAKLTKLFTLLTILALGITNVWGADPVENVGTYSTQVISADGTTSTWTFITPGSQVTIPTSPAETEDNDIIFHPGGGSKMKFSSSNGLSWSGNSDGYIYVPAGAAGSISMTVKSASDSRWLQLYVGGEDQGSTKRLWSKEANPATEARGPRTFTFTSSDLTTKGTKTYLHLKDNNTELKIATFTVTLTTGSYIASSGGGEDPVCPSGLSITSKNDKTAFLEGDAIELTAALTAGNGTITYQWYKGGTAESNKLTGKTAAKLEIASCVEGDAGDYYCVASKSDCSDAVNADAFTITVAHNPCATHHWFVATADATSNGVTNWNGFTNGVTGSSGQTNSVTIDGTTYSLTKRTGSTGGGGTILGFTIPANKAGTLYGYMKSSGSAARTLSLKKGDDVVKTNTEIVDGNWTLITIDAIAPGTYTLSPDQNVQVQMFVLKVCDATFRTITLEYSDGVTADGSLDALDGAPATKPTDPTWAHHRFDGWYNGETPYNWTANVTGDLTLTAHWTQLYTVTYEAGDGTATGDAPTEADKAKTETFTVAANSFTVAGKDFVKWNDGTNDYAPGATYTVGTDNVVLTAQWKAAADKYTVIFKDGETELGTKLFEVSTNPSDADIDKTKALNTFAAWQKEGVDIALDDAFWATVTKDAEITLTARWAKAFATSVDLEGLVEASGTGADWQKYLSDHGYAFSTSNVSLDEKKDPSENKPYDNWPYQGLKAKVSGAYVEGNIEAGKLVIIKLGHMAAAATITVDGVAQANATGLDAAEPAGAMNYYYLASEGLLRYETTNAGACILKAITITDPYTVSFDANGGDDVASLNGTPSVTLPLPTKGTESFLGWFDGETNVGMNGDKYTPTANITLVAHWEAVSTDARLSAITFSSAAGTLAPAFDPEVTEYTYTMPYGTTAIPTITSGTAVNANAKTPIIGDAATAWGEAQTIKGVAQSDDKKTYTITMKVAPKDGVCLVWADVSADNTLTYNATNSKFYAESDVTLQNSNVKGKDGSAPSGKKFQTNGFLKIALNEGTFLAGDVVALNVTYGTANVMHVFKAQAATSTDVIGEATGNTDAGLNKVAITEDAATLWLVRGGDYGDWNPHVDYVAVYRAMNPILTAITINGETGTINESAKTVAVELQPGYDLAALTIVPTIVSNTAEASVVKTVESNGGAWVIGDNTYRLTDKDGDYTEYTVTLTAGELKHNVSFNTHGGSTIDPVQVVDGQKLAAAPADPTKDDYIFQGWAETEDGSIVDVTSFTISADKEFHAVWAADGAIKLLDGATVNHTNFITGVTADETVEFMGNTVNYAKFSGTVSGVNGVKDLTRVIAYNATTNKTKIRIYAHNNSTSGRNILVKGLVEGADAATDLATIALGNKEDKVSDWIEFDNAANRTIYIFVGSSAGDVYFTQVKVIESGETPMKQAGETGYSLNFNKGRFFGVKDITAHFEGLDVEVASSDCAPLNTEVVKLASTSMSFTVASAMTLSVTTNNNKTYYVTEGAAGTDNETAKTGVSEFNLTAGTWYITAGASNVEITNIAFTAPKCAEPVIDAQPASKLDFAAGDMTASVTAHATDGGTLSYQWYKADDSEVTGQITETLTTTEEGTYYVIVTNKLADHSDNFVKSDNATLKYRKADDATLSALTVSAGTLDPIFDPAVLEYNVTLSEGTVDVPTLTATAAMATYGATAVVTDAAAFVNYEATSTVLVTAEDHSTQQTYIVHFYVDHTILALVDVTGDMTWDFSKDGLADQATVGTEVIMANVAGVVNDANFKSDNIKVTANKQVGTKLQASMIMFHTTVDGLIKVVFSNTGDKSSERYLVVNGKKTDSGTKTKTNITYYGFVPAGDVVLTVIEGDGNMLNFASVQFTAKAAADLARDAAHGDDWMAPGELGTVCIPNGAVATGGDLYTLEGKNSDGKIVFATVPNNKMTPGVPYLFQATSNAMKFFYTEEATVAAPDNSGAMKGTFVDLDLTDLTNVYYFAGHALWSCSDLTSLEVKAYRAWVDMSKVGSGANPAPGRRYIIMDVHGQNAATGIGNVQGDEVQSTKVLINGELFILRGEKMYDATGRLVK